MSISSVWHKLIKTLARYDVPLSCLFCYNIYNSKTPSTETEVSAMKNTALITGSTGGLGSCFVKIHAQTGESISEYRNHKIPG